MAVLVATLGYTASLALAPLRDRPDISEVHLLYGKPVPEEGRAAVKDARATAKTLGVKLHEHKVPGAFDYEAVLGALAVAYAGMGQEEVLVNASGGTRVMVMAATIFAFTNDLPLLYYDEYQTARGQVIPLKALRRLRDLGESQRAILQRLQKGAADMGTLASDVGLAPSTLSVHVQRLVEAGIVTVTRQGKHRVATAATPVLAMSIGGPE